MSGLVCTTTATEFPIDKEFLKLHAHVDANDEDLNIDEYIGAATNLAQRMLDRQLCTATFRWTLDCFPDATRHNPQAALYPPRPPLGSSTGISIGYINSAGTTVTMATSDYIVDTNSEPGRITPAYGQVWPVARDQINAVTVTYTAGYGAAAAVPKPIRTWILTVAAYLFREREPVNIGNITTPLPHFDNLLYGEDYGRV